MKRVWCAGAGLVSLLLASACSSATPPGRRRRIRKRVRVCALPQPGSGLRRGEWRARDIGDAMLAIRVQTPGALELR